MIKEWIKSADRKNQIIIFISIFFAILLIKLGYLTIVKGDYYRELSENKRLKEIPIAAKRGEIFDRNGKLLATNKPSFNVYFENGNLTREELNTVALKTIKILDKANEKHILFPIEKNGNSFSYTFDKEKNQWLKSNGFSQKATSKEVLDFYRQRESISSTLSDGEAYNVLVLKGIILPISTSKGVFWYDTRKSDFLKLYKIEEIVSAKEAFNIIKAIPKMELGNRYSDDDTIKILALVHQVVENSYMRYKPLTIAENVSVETASLISEMKIELTGIDVAISPIRTYPYKNLASHTIGYMGKLSSDAEKQKYVVDNKYSENQIIGKTGIEGKYELELRGKDGKRFIQVDALGRAVDNTEGSKLAPVEPVAGKDITLTIDMDLQKNLDNYLERTIKGIVSGGAFQSKWGNSSFWQRMPNVGSGAAVVVEVKTGKILAKSSYPDFNLNDFSTGISSKDWKKLEPRNPRDPLAPRPLYDYAAFSATQPGSTFKMVTAFAAFKKGLSPYTSVYDTGFIELGGRKFGCWIYNMYNGKHGYTNMIKAIEVSCNYYFFCVSDGYDYSSNRSLGYTMSTEELLDTAKSFGLGQPTGIEIPETAAGLPDASKKKDSIAYLLRSKLVQYSSDYFIPSIANDKSKLDATIDTIIKWSDNNPSRGDIVTKLDGLGVVNPKFTSSRLADIIKYDYFNSMAWSTGDKFNLSIGQGDHKYTVLQMARYISAVANGGYVNELSIVEKIGDEKIVKNKNIKSIDFNGGLSYIRQGVALAASGDEGTSSNVFIRFPIKVGTKTGTAQNQSSIPPKDEKAYLKSHLHQINSKLTWSKVVEKSKKILRTRSKEITDLKDKIDAITEDTQEKKDLQSHYNALLSSNYLEEENALRMAIIELSNYKVTGTDINRFRAIYDDYVWFVSFAPLDDPQIAVAVMIPQGGHGGYGAPLVREIYADYFGLNKKEKTKNTNEQ